MIYNRGFSIIELVIVLLISSLIATVVVPNYSKIHDFAKKSTLKQQAYSLQVAIETYFLDEESYPDSSGDIEELLTTLSDAGVLTNELINPYTGDTFSNEDSLGVLSYTYDSDLEAYVIDIYTTGDAPFLTLSN